MTPRRSLRAGVVALGILASVACNKEEKDREHESDKTVAAASAAPVLDTKVSKVVAEVTKNQGRSSESGSTNGQGEGPPETGVFSVQRANQEHSPGAPSSLTLGGSGTGKKVKLGAIPDTDFKPVQGALEVAAATGPRSALPTVVLGLKVGPAKGAASDAGAALPMRAELAKVSLAEQQPGQLPPELEARIKKLAGSVFDFSVNTAGAIGDFRAELKPGTEPDLMMLLQRGAEAVQNILFHAPSEPVGAGAFWVVRARSSFNETDVITYRMYKLEELSEEEARLSVTIRRYAASPKTQMAGVPAEHELVQFRGEGSAVLFVKPGSFLPVRAEFAEQTQMLVTSGGGDSRPQVLPMELRGRYTAAGSSAAPGAR